MPTDATEKEKHAGSDIESRLPAVLPSSPDGGHLSIVEGLAEIPEEEIWLGKQKSKRTRRAYRQDVAHFMRALRICSYEELRRVDHRAVIVWERIMRDDDKAAASTIRRRLAALSSLMKHLTRHGHLAKNHVAEVERPAINREEGTTRAFSQAQARKILANRAPDTIEGLRDRAILSVGLQVGLRRAEIAALEVDDLHQNRGYDSLRIHRKGGRRDARHPSANGPAHTGLSGSGPACTRTLSTGYCASMRGRLGSDAGIRRIRCARRSSLQRSKMAHPLKRSRKPPGTAIREPRSCTIGAAIIRRSQRRTGRTIRSRRAESYGFLASIARRGDKRTSARD